MGSAVKVNVMSVPDEEVPHWLCYCFFLSNIFPGFALKAETVQIENIHEYFVVYTTIKVGGGGGSFRNRTTLKMFGNLDKKAVSRDIGPEKKPSRVNI